jgi:hypothetical protein
MDATLEPIHTIRRKITTQDMQDMAKLMAKRITETGACLMLGLRPESWFNFKARVKNTKKFEDILVRVRESKLSGIIDNIEAAGDPYDVVTKTGQVYQRPGDWRAKAWLAERVLAPERLGQQVVAGSTTTNTVIVGQLGGGEALAKLVSMYCTNAKALNPPTDKPAVDCPALPEPEQPK